MIDIPARIVAGATHLLPRGRGEWGAAMAAELSHIVDGPARWVFALECLRGALIAPAPRGERQPAVTTLFLLGVAGCVASWIYITRTWPHAGAAVTPVTIAQFVATLTLYAWLAIRPPNALIRHGDAARSGANAGFVLFFVITVVSPILDAIIRTRDPDTFVLILEVPAVVGTFALLGYFSARDERSFGSGLTAAFWAGMVCSILSYNADLITLLGQFDLEGHYRGIGGDRTLVLANPEAFLSKHVGDHLNATMLSLRGFPMLALGMGALGAGMARLRDRPSGSRRPIVIVA